MRKKPSVQAEHTAYQPRRLASRQKWILEQASPIRTPAEPPGAASEPRHGPHRPLVSTASRASSASIFSLKSGP